MVAGLTPNSRGELTGTSRPDREQVDRSTTDRVGECLERHVDLFDLFDLFGRPGHVHVDERIGAPSARSASAFDTSRTWVENVHECPSGSSAR